MAAPRFWIPPSLGHWSASAGPSQQRGRLLSLSDTLQRRGPGHLRALSDRDLLRAWSATVEAFRDPDSAQRQSLDADLCTATHLSPQCLSASLAALLEGFGDGPVQRLLERGRTFDSGRPTLVILASTVPGLVLQPLLTCLALRQPVLIKTASREPYFTAAFLAALAEYLPAIGESVAAVTWKGGEARIESALLERWGAVVAYGAAATLADLRRRVGARLVAYGPKASLGVISGIDAGDREVLADGLATDVALFAQRGCLSVQAVYTDSQAPELARALAAALERAGRRWPEEADPRHLAAVRQLRSDCELRGLKVEPLPLRHGTVILDPDPEFRLSPGLRTVRVHPLEKLERLPQILRPHAGQLQGVSLAGSRASALHSELEKLGVSRFSAPGHLQSAPADWLNDHIDLLQVLGEASD